MLDPVAVANGAVTEERKKRKRGFEGLRVRECEVRTSFLASLHMANGHRQSRRQSSSGSSDDKVFRPSLSEAEGLL